MNSPAIIDLPAYLTRVDFRGEPRPDLATLRALHEAHVTHIPFENFDIHLGRGIRIDLESVQAKLVRACRGGYCFEQNALFAAALEQIGFSVTRLSARVRLSIAAVLPRTHMLLKVEAEGRSWICDVGFGGWGLLLPVALVADLETEQEAWTYRLRREEEGIWVLQCLECPAGPDLYAFDLTRNLPVDYEPANFYTSTHPQSRFVLSLSAQRIERGVRHVLRNRELVTIHAHGTHAELIETNEQLLDVLAVRFGIQLPAGTRFPQFEPVA